MPHKASMVISFVMVVGIGIALVSAAYVWGSAILEKRSSIIEFETAKNFMLNLQEEIVRLADEQSGEVALNIPVGSMSVDDDTSGNNINLVFTIPQAIALEGSTVYLGVTTYSDITNEVGTFGESSPGVLKMTTQRGISGQDVVLQLHFRPLKAGNREFRISLDTGGGAGSGSGRIIASYDRTVTQQGAGHQGEDVELIYIRVTVA